MSATEAASIYLALRQASCGHCGGIHTGTTCPRIEEIEYHENGTVKRIKYRGDQ